MKKIAAFYSIIFLFSCSNLNKKAEDHSSLEESAVNLTFDYCGSEKNKENIFNLQSIEFQPLETSDECLISEISKAIYKKGFYYILDRKLASIFIFNSDGNFISKIHNVGGGPGEYPDMFDFDLDADRNIYMVSVAGRKIIKYNSPEYNSFKEFNVDASILEIAVDEKSGNIWVTNAFDSEEGICLGLFTEKGIKTIIKSRGIFDNISSTLKMQSFYKSGDNLFFNPRFSPYIYLINNDEVTKYMKIDTENFVQDKDIESENESKEKRSPVNVSKCLVYGVKSFYQYKDVLFMDIWRNLDAPLILRYNLEKSNGQLFYPLKEDSVKVYTKIITVSDNGFTGYINAPSFVKYYDNSLVEKYNINEDDNPVLVFYKLDD